MAQEIGAAKDIGVGLLGCGSWGHNHLRVWSELGLLRAVCDSNPARLEKVHADYPGLALHARAADVLERPDIDAVVIATPAATHEDLALLALARGKDVLVEKPLALTYAGGQRIVEAARRAQRILLVGHVLEYHPAVRRLEELIGKGALGRVQYTYSNRVNLGRFRAEENALWSFAPHDVAVMLRLLGDEVEEVSCHGGAYLHHDIADLTLTALSFRNGVRGHIFVSWLHPFKEHRFVIVGDRQMAVFDDALPWSEKLSLYPHSVSWLEGRNPIVHKAEAVPVPLAPADSLALECAHFVECVRTRAEPRTAGASGVRVLRILDAAQRSLERGGIPEHLDRPVSRAYDAHPTATIDPGARIGDGTKIWHHTHVMGSASIGPDCMLGQNVFVAAGVTIGRGVRIQNNVSVYEGVELEDDVFCGPSMVFTNVTNPRAAERRRDFRRTLVRRGATIGANATIICGVTLGRYAFVAAGAVVTHDVPDHGLVMGVPARLVGWACECGERLVLDSRAGGCAACGKRYRWRSATSIEREIDAP